MSSISPDAPSDELGVANLRFERRGPIAWCTIDRPEARNALSPQMYAGLGKALALTTSAPGLEALVITGVGDVFIPGGDMGSQDGEVHPLPFHALRNARVPVVTAINGICQASGLLIALLSDVAIASDRATFRAPELLRGFPEMWFAAVLPAHIGHGRARELTLTGRVVDAQEALAIGLIERVVEHDRLLEAAEAAAYQILETAPVARNTFRQGLNARYGVVDEMTIDAAMVDGEAVEGFRSFVEKRPPSWSPRSRHASVD